MDANAFRYLFDYHFSENRKIWNSYISQLTQEQFTHEVPYSHGSVLSQLVHLMNTDASWFSELQRIDLPQLPGPADFIDRNLLRAHWDDVERAMRLYLAGLQDDMLFSKPIIYEGDENLIVWQVLLHLVNHATDHRAQLLRVLHDMGLKTGPQDLIFYIFDQMDTVSSAPGATPG